MNEKTKPNTPAAKPAALLYTMRKSNLIRDCDLPGVPGYTRIWRGSLYYGRLLLIGWRRGKPASLPKNWPVNGPRRKCYEP